MKLMLTISAAAVAVACLASAVQAQETPESAIIGPSGNAAYPLEVQGANGVAYNCRDETVVANGRIERRCIRRGGAGQANVGGLTGLTTPGILGGVAALVLLGASNNGGGSSSDTN